MFTKKRNHWIIFCASAFALAAVMMCSIFVASELRTRVAVSPAVSGARSYNLGAKAKSVKLFFPKPMTALASPLVVRGEARGWYFEGSFPVELKDANGEVIATGIARAESDWMTDAFVPFAATLDFSAPKTATGILTLKKDNPSGLSQYDDSVSVPVKFALSKGAAARECRPSGCSGQVCSDQDVITTCEYAASYACYKKAVCARQATGECGWTKTDELIACLNGAGN
jgi:hypothetical protein